MKNLFTLVAVVVTAVSLIGIRHSLNQARPSMLGT